ncbi:hypothetical protein BKA82DRAFT_4225445, partial [Pisolithus tinctorius]
PTGYPGVRPPASFQSQQTGFHDAPGGPGGLLQAQPTGFPGAQSRFGQRPPLPPIPSIPSQFQQDYPPPPPPLAPLQQPSSFLNLAQNSTPANLSAPYAAGGAPQLQPAPQRRFGGLSLQQSFQQHNQQHGRGTAPKVPWALSKAEKKTWDAQGTGFISGQTALEEFGQCALDRNDLAKIWFLVDADNRGKLNIAERHVAMGIICRKIPDELPPELVPPSSRDLDTSVNFLKYVLKDDTRAGSPSALNTPVSRLKERSFTSSSTMLMQRDVPLPGGFYQSSVRHVDLNAVRLQSDERQLLNTQKMLDDNLSSEHLEDLRYRIKRLQEDVKYDEERRIEKELMKLMHEDVPELERKREWANERDKRNESRYSPAPESRSGSRYEKDERDYYDRNGKKSYRSEESDRQLDRENIVDTRVNSPPRAAPAPSRSPALQLKNMTPEQRKAYIQAQAKRRLEERMQALGVSSPALTSAVSPTLDSEKREAEEKAREAERQAEEREQGKAPAPSSVPRPTPTPTTPAAKAVPPAPKPHAPAPPPPRKGAAPRTPAAVAVSARSVQSSLPAPAPPAPAEPEEDPEDKREEQEGKMNEEAYHPAVSAVSSTQNSPVPPAPPAPSAPPAPLVSVQPTPEVGAEEAAFSPPPAPPASTPGAAADKPSNNPFNRLKKDANAPAPETTPAPANVGNIRAFRRPSSPRYHIVPSGTDDDWDEVVEKEDDDSSDEELATRDTRVGLAQQLFGSLLPTRPQSAGPAPQPIGNPVSPTFLTPPPPPPAPAVPAPSNAVATAGRIIGDNTPPAHIGATPRPPSPPSPPAPAAPVLPVTEASELPQVESTSTSKHRPKESATLDRLPETVEEEEYAGDVPGIRVSEHVPDGGSDPTADVDELTRLRVRSLYAYEAQRMEDLSINENIVMEAHPSKSGGDWWYGTTANDSRSGFFPQTYVQVLEPVQATALYSYEGSGPNELSFNEGDVLTIVDRVESDWWRAERDGVVYAVPAAYVEVAEG